MSEELSREEQLGQKREYWKRQIESWQGSGLCQTEFCRKYDLRPNRFTYWKKRFVQAKTGITFVPVKIHKEKPASPAAVKSSSLRIIVEKDIQIEVDPNFDPLLLREVIAAVRSSS